MPRNRGALRCPGCSRWRGWRTRSTPKAPPRHTRCTEVPRSRNRCNAWPAARLQRRRWLARNAAPRWPRRGWPKHTARSARSARRCANVRRGRPRMSSSAGWPSSRPISSGGANGLRRCRLKPMRAAAPCCRRPKPTCALAVDTGAYRRARPDCDGGLMVVRLSLRVSACRGGRPVAQPASFIPREPSRRPALPAAKPRSMPG